MTEVYLVEHRENTEHVGVESTVMYVASTLEKAHEWCVANVKDLSPDSINFTERYWILKDRVDSDKVFDDTVQAVYSYKGLSFTMTE